MATDPTTTPDLLALANRLTVARVRAGLSQAVPAVPAADNQEPDVDLVHRVAAAICAVDAPADHPDIWGSPEDWYAEARAAIAAMREVPRA